jgi:hypothetical protein
MDPVGALLRAGKVHFQAELQCSPPPAPARASADTCTITWGFHANAGYGLLRRHVRRSFGDSSSGFVHLRPQSGRIVVRTYREGLAQAIGHDLVIEVGPFTAMMGALKVADRVDIEFEVDLPT